MPKFLFSVDIPDVGTDLRFQEVTGLETEPQVIEYRHGDSPSFYPIKMPGLGRVGNVTLKKGVFVNDEAFWAWLSEIKTNQITGRTMTIKLLDEAATPKMTWTLSNAWPTKITGTDLKSEGKEVAVETIEIAYETVTVSS